MITNQTDGHSGKRPCKIITLREKVAILKQLEAGTSRRDVEAMFKCSQSTISRVLAGKEGIIQDAKNNIPNKRDNLISYKALDKALSRWASEMKKSDALITASLAKRKAEELSLAMGQELRPSTGWLYKWKERENIKFAKRTKHPEEIIREFLDKRETSKHMQRIHAENGNRPKVVIEEAEINSSQNLQTYCPQSNGKNSGNKPRIKRDYVKRLPIIDANGLICRNRKEKTFLTLLQKLEILQRLKNGERRPDLTVEYKLSQSAMSQIVTDEEKILKLAAGGQNLQMKRIRGGIFKGGESELNEWVRNRMDNGESLTRTQIKNKAREIANRLNIEFKASTGWLEKWKTRMNLDFNENQILQRKVPNYMATDDDYESSLAQFEHIDTFHEQQNGLVLQNHIKEELIDNDYCEDFENNDEFNYTDIDTTEVKNEVLTPQQFYLHAIRSDRQESQSYNDSETNQSQTMELLPEYETNIKPFFSTSTQVKDSPRSTETLHEQVLSWLNRYNVAPVAASELLNILQPLLCR